MAILITGAAGFVALNVVEHLLTAGRDVVGLDRIALPSRAQRTFGALPGRFTLIGGSILSTADLRRALTIAPIEAVIHCAVITAGSAREKSDPETIVAVNIQGAVATVMAAARQGVKTFVYPIPVRSTAPPHVTYR
jgi:nucleoside-diphosphate-sugar epimerase